MPTISNLALSVIALVALLVLWSWQRGHPEFDLSDLITGDNGRVSTSKFMQAGAWVVGTWGFVTMVQQGKMTEWYFAGYMGLCFGVRVAKDIWGKTGPGPTP
jgi:Protein of unknown function (DUF2644)